MMLNWDFGFLFLFEVDDIYIKWRSVYIICECFWFSISFQYNDVIDSGLIFPISVDVSDWVLLSLLVWVGFLFQYKAFYLLNIVRN